MKKFICSGFLAGASLVPGLALADSVPAAHLDSGNTAWMLTSTALVLLMTLPGLALFYGGMVRKKNVLSVLMQQFAITCLVTVLWMVAGYSLAFTPGTPLVGGASRFMLSGLGIDAQASNNIPESVFMMFQMTFAIITPGLIFGAVAERMKFSAALLYAGLWSLIVYAPVAHWVWGPDGWLASRGMLDYAGGSVVHINSGFSALVAALLLGKRLGYGKEPMAPHNMVLTLIGGALLWVGWFGFNAGSALAADGHAGMAMATTMIATAAAALSWMAVEWFSEGKPSLLGIISGAIAGLVVITPACGFVAPGGALVMGLIGGAFCFWTATRLKKIFRVDDSLDAFGVHGFYLAANSYCAASVCSLRKFFSLTNMREKMTAKALIRKGFEAPKSTVKRIAQGALLAVATAGVSGMAMAADAKPVLNSGDTAWTMVSAALVLLMTIPGLAIFYGGLTRAKNMLSVLAQCTVITAAVSIVWVVAGYSLAFAPGTPFIGGLSKAFMAGIGINTLNNTIPEMAFALFQMTFAIITPALIIGAFAERMKFSALLLFSVLWSLAVYSPIAHMVWGPGGWLAGKGVLDFAGGTVVHIAAGISALVAALVIGKRLGYGKTAMPPNNLAMTMIGAAMLWVGWFGFNGGSELAADGRAAMALMVTQVATAAAVLAWMALEWWIGGKPSLLGMVSGAVAGLVAITPASGFVGPMGAIAIGIAAGAVCYWMVTVAKHKLGYDDTLDAFGIHGAGGVVGAILTGVFAVKGIGGTAGALEGNIGQIWVQTQGVLVTLVYAGIGTFILLKLVDLMVGLRVSEEEEYTGLDLSQHGERLVVDTEGLRIFEPASMSGHAGAPTPDAVILGKPKPGH